MLRRWGLASVLVLMLALWAPTTAIGSDPVTCAPPSVYNRISGTCTIVVTNPGGPAAPTSPPAKGGGGQAAGTGAKACVDANGDTLACRDGDAWWSSAWGCYAKPVTPPPPKSDPRWQGHDDGALYECYDPLVAGAGGMAITYRWSATPPAGPAAPPDPRVLAQQAVAQMRLRAVAIGIVPEPGPGRVGIIGMPTWMWVQDPGPATLGPVTRTASAGGFSVTATAKADRVVWQMGDGTTVTCRGPGSPYADSFGRQSSPDCGHTYTRQGTYTVRATSHWTVEWSGIGLSGTIPLTFTQAATITMGEAQALTQ